MKGFAHLREKLNKVRIQPLFSRPNLETLRSLARVTTATCGSDVRRDIADSLEHRVLYRDEVFDLELGLLLAVGASVVEVRADGLEVIRFVRGACKKGFTCMF